MDKRARFFAFVAVAQQTTRPRVERARRSGRLLMSEGRSSHSTRLRLRVQPAPRCRDFGASGRARAQGVHIAALRRRNRNRVALLTSSVGPRPGYDQTHGAAVQARPGQRAAAERRRRSPAAHRRPLPRARRARPRRHGARLPRASTRSSGRELALKQLQQDAPTSKRCRQSARAVRARVPHARAAVASARDRGLRLRRRRGAGRTTRWSCSTAATCASARRCRGARRAS